MDETTPGPEELNLVTALWWNVPGGMVEVEHSANRPWERFRQWLADGFRCSVITHRRSDHFAGLAIESHAQCDFGLERACLVERPKAGGTGINTRPSAAHLTGSFRLKFVELIQHHSFCSRLLTISEV